MSRIDLSRETRVCPNSRITARAASFAALAVLLVATVGVNCDPGSIRVVNRPPDPRLVDEHGDVDADGFAALVVAVEEERGLGFIQQPRLELLAPDDPRLPALRASALALEPCPRAEATSIAESAPAPIGPRCFADPSLDFTLCLAPPDLDAARRVLRRLLDAQNYPRLARAAPRLRGDPGVAIRAVLAASAAGAIRPSRERAAFGDTDPIDVLDLPKIDVERQGQPGGSCTDLGSAFLASQSDREAPFRTPPLSTLMLLRPKVYRASERPLLLVAKPMGVAGCEVDGDESLGVARILVELVAKGGSISGAALAGWRGDRALHFTCGDGEPPWIYVAELADAAHATEFAKAVPHLLPGALPGPAETQRIGRRIVIAHRIGSPQARAWAAALETRELLDFEGTE